MRTSALMVLVPALALAAAPSKKPVVAILPTAADVPELSTLGLLIDARAEELVEAAGGYSQLHAKQVAAMAEQEGLSVVRLSEPEVAAAARVVLGADRVVSVVLEKTDTGMNLLGAVYDGSGKEAPFTEKLPADWAVALSQGSEAVAKAVLAPEKAALPKVAAQPVSKSQKGLEALGRCYAPVIRQSLGIEAPVLVQSEVLDAAIADCAEAAATDKGLRYAFAAKALAQAVVGDDAEAAASLKAAGEGKDVLWPATLARFWLTTRYQSNDAGVEALTAAIAKHPGELILRSYLGDTLIALGRYRDAVKVWTEYLALAPRSAFAQGRLSRALARLSMHDEAIAAAKKALELAPQGRDAQLQLGSRYVDAGQYQAAVAALTPLADAKDARGEAVQRLGYALQLAGDAAGAAKQYRRAVDLAKAPGDWRTRGRALYNLAIVEQKQGHGEAAAAAYKQSVDTGYRVKQVDPALKSIAEKSAPPAQAPAAPKESSLFPADSSGELNPAASKPAAPKGLEPNAK